MERAAPPPSDPTKLIEASNQAARANQLVAMQRYRQATDTVEGALALLAPGNLADDRVLFQLEMIRAEAFRHQQDLTRALLSFEAALAAAWRHENELRAQIVEATLRGAETLRALHRDPAAIDSLERALRVVGGDPSVDRSLRVAAALIAAHRSAGSPTRTAELLTAYVTAARRFDPKTQVASDIDAMAVFEEPKPPPSPPGVETNAGDVSNAAITVAEMRAGFRTCYQQALAQSSVLEGTVHMMLRIGADGHVTDVRGAAFGLQATTLDCLLRRASESVFSPPEGGSAQIAVPVAFVKH